MHVAEIPRRRRRSRRFTQVGMVVTIGILFMAYVNLNGFDAEHPGGRKNRPLGASANTRITGATSPAASSAASHNKLTAKRPINTLSKDAAHRKATNGVTPITKPKRSKLIKGKGKGKEEDGDDYEDDYDYDYDYDEDAYDEDDDEADEYEEDDEDDVDDEHVDLTPVSFFDADGDKITFKIGRSGQLCELVNGRCEVKDVRELSYDWTTRTITDESGSFKVGRRNGDAILRDIVRLAKLAYPRVKLYGFPTHLTRGRQVSILNHESIEEAIKSEQNRIANASRAIEGMEQLLSKWQEQLADEETQKAKEGLPTWQRIHLASSIKRRKKDVERLQNDIAAMQKARAYMEETVVLFQHDLNETTSGPVVPPLPPCRSVVAANSQKGGWEFNPLHTGSATRSESPNSFFITVQTPGMEMDDIKVSVKDSTLFVKGAIEQLLEGGSCVQTLNREFELPVNADASRISATLQQGALTVEIPKINSAPGGEEKSVQINVEKVKTTEKSKEAKPSK